MNFTEIQKLWKLIGRGEPQTAIETYIMGAVLYKNDEIEGEAACSLIFTPESLIKDNKSPSGFRLNQQEKQNLNILKKNPDIIRSYIKDINNPKITLRKKEVARSRAKLFIKSNLKDLPIPIILIKENGYWKIIDGTLIISNIIEEPN